MKKVYYKVVTPELKSFWVLEPRLVTQYKVGEFVNSPIPETPLAVFDNYKAAEDFLIGTGRNGLVYSCKIIGKTKFTWLPGTSRHFYYFHLLDRIVKRIRAKKSYKYLLDNLYIDLPKDTVTCKKVKLLELVYTQKERW